jgi:TatD DNase family protein
MFTPRHNQLLNESPSTHTIIPMENDLVVPEMSDSHFHSVPMAHAGLDPGKLLADLRSAGAGPMLDVAIVPDDCEEQRRYTGAVGDVYYSCGIHPVASGREDWEEAFVRVESEIDRGGYHAVGETGLDWYRMYAPRERQVELFRRQLSVARDARLPVIVHNRDADDDVLAALTAARLSVPGIMHCYSSSAERVAAFLDLGMYISFAGNVTFRNADELRRAAAAVPRNRILLETDAPFLAPHPFRGKTNHPGMLVHTLRAVADTRDESPADLAATTAANLRRVLQLPPAP